MSDKVIDILTKRQYETEQKLFEELIATIDKYQGKLSLVSALGIIDLVHDEVKLQAKNK